MNSWSCPYFVSLMLVFVFLYLILLFHYSFSVPFIQWAVLPDSK